MNKENTNEYEEIDEDSLKEYENSKAMLVTVKTEGGGLILDSLKDDVEGRIESLLNTYQDKSHIELVAILAKIEARRELLNHLLNIEEKVNIFKKEYGKRNKPSS